jgi:hypothetical protein
MTNITIDKNNLTDENQSNSHEHVLSNVLHIRKNFIELVYIISPVIYFKLHCYLHATYPSVK